MSFYKLLNNYYPKMIYTWNPFKELNLLSNLNEIKYENYFNNLLIQDESKTLDKLGDRMKRYEAQNEHKINPFEYYIVRLDGKCFSSFTKKFQKPFDDNFVKAMAMTTRDLIEYFGAQTGYTHSDEITLIFNSKCSREIYDNRSELIIEHNYNGRIEKILSLISSYCSVRFNFHINNIIAENENISEYSKDLIILIKKFQQIFDARILIFNEDNKHEILNHQIWRVRDCTRNCILTYGHTYLGKKNIISKKTNEIIIMLKDKEILMENIPFYLKYGLYCKKNKIEKIINGNKCLRTEFIFTQFEINYSDDNLNILLDKYWNQDFLDKTFIYNF